MGEVPVTDETQEEIARAARFAEIAHWAVLSTLFSFIVGFFGQWWLLPRLGLERLEFGEWCVFVLALIIWQVTLWRIRTHVRSLT